jgi:predicted MFS family arabinose efflux permease
VRTPSAPTKPSRRGTFESLRVHRNYRLYFVGQIVSYSGSFMQDTALPWLVLERTHSPVLVGLLVFCRYGPFAVLGLYGGVVADRFDNRRVLIAAEAAAMVFAVVLTFIAFSGAAPLWAVYALTIGLGISLAFDNPNKYALIYRLVDREGLPNAISLSITLQNAARIVGPALGGVVIAAFGVGWCFLFNAASYVFLLVCLLLMRTSEMFAVDRPDEHGSPLRSLREGFSYARNSRELQALMGIAVVFGLFGFSAIRTLMPVLAAQTLHGGPQTFGALYGSYGAGAVMGGLVSATLARASWRRLFAGALTFSGVTVLLAPVPSAVLAAFLLALIGAAWTTWASQAQSIAVLAAPDRLRGRVISLFHFSLLVGVPFGGLLGGWLASAGGTELAFSVAGSAGLLATGTAAFSLRHERRRSRQREAFAHE